MSWSGRRGPSTRSIGDEDEPLTGGAEMVREQLADVSFPRWIADGRPGLSAMGVPV